MSCNSAHACVLDAKFFSQQGHLLVQPIVLGSDSHSVTDAIRSPTVSLVNREVSQRDNV